MTPKGRAGVSLEDTKLKTEGTNTEKNTATKTLDMSKAFDTVPINRLCSKLSHYGICGNVLRWIKSFLMNRSQQVVVNGEYIQLCKATSGEPQGSVLGPLLFLCYINDIVHNISSQIRLYAKILYSTEVFILNKMW